MASSGKAVAGEIAAIINRKLLYKISFLKKQQIATRQYSKTKTILKEIGQEETRKIFVLSLLVRSQPGKPRTF